MRRAPPSNPKSVTREWLLRAALYYLQRYAASTEHLRSILLAKAERRQADPEADRETRQERQRVASALVDEVIEQLRELRLLDDDAFAQAKLRVFRRKGLSAPAAKAKLLGKGLSSDTVSDALREDETSEHQAAAAFVRRHRLRALIAASGDDPERRRKALAKMMRAGFNHRIAQAALDGLADDEDEPPSAF